MVWIKRTLWKSQRRELIDHKNNTAWDLIKIYSKAQLSFMDWVDQRTIESNSKRYLPVRVDSWPAMDRYRRWTQCKPYRIMYIRLDEVKSLYHRKTWNKLVVEIQ